jgi:hypothetical protein
MFFVEILAGLLSAVFVAVLFAFAMAFVKAPDVLLLVLSIVIIAFLCLTGYRWCQRDSVKFKLFVKVACWTLCAFFVVIAYGRFLSFLTYNNIINIFSPEILSFLNSIVSSINPSPEDAELVYLLLIEIVHFAAAAIVVIPCVWAFKRWKSNKNSTVQA